jgi:hypothetical protein
MKMFKLILLLAFLDANGEPQTRELEYSLRFGTIDACQQQVRETMDVTEQIIQAGGQVIGVSYTCVFDPSIANTETEA